MDRAQQVFDTLIHQWKTGGNAELKFFCERGSLRVNFDADLGPWRPAPGEVQPKYGDYRDYVKPPSPSRLRRKERRAAERERSAAIGAAAVNAVPVRSAAAEKADTELIANRQAAEDVDATVRVAGEVLEAAKAAGEVLTAEKAADELVTAAIAADGLAVEKTANKVVAVEKAAIEESYSAKRSENEVSVVKAATAEVASTSSCGKEQRTAKTFDHQCEGPSVTVRSRPSPSPPSESPSRTSSCHGVFPPRPEKVKCHVCACLGRETSMVLIGSTCPSCGVTAFAEIHCM